MAISEDVRSTRAEWLAAEEACELGTKPFFEDDLVLTEERKEKIRELFIRRDDTRSRYDKALRAIGWPGPHHPSTKSCAAV